VPQVAFDSHADHLNKFAWRSHPLCPAHWHRNRVQAAHYDEMGTDISWSTVRLKGSSHGGGLGSWPLLSRLNARAASENASGRVASVLESSWSSMLSRLGPSFLLFRILRYGASFKLGVTFSNLLGLNPDEALLTGTKHPLDKREYGPWPMQTAQGGNVAK
jgi:hypothetical protein